MVKIHTETYGDGPTDLVVCNGLSQTTANWRGLARQFGQFRWILFDARGMGKSQMGPRPYQLDHHVEDLLQVIDRHKVQRPFVMGFSHGGRVALRAAAQNPGAFRALGLISVGARQSAKRRAYFRSWHETLNLGGVKAMAWASLPSIVGPKILEKFPDLELLAKGTEARNSLEGLQAMFEGIHSYPLIEDDARRVDLPTWLVRGDVDPLVDASDLEDFANWIANTKRDTFAGCGHTVPLEEPRQFIDAAERFLATL